jgi:urea transport system ATP-binding protein
MSENIQADRPSVHVHAGSPELARTGLNEQTILWVDNVSVSFEGFRALTDLTIALDPGELRCVIGPNGAGKTTMMDVITGKTRPDTGRVYMFGQTLDITERSESEIAELGIGRKFQRPTVFENLSVFQNLELALKTKKTIWRSLFGRLSSEQADRIGQALRTINLGERAHTQAGLLAHGQKQWLEIGMLLVQDPKVLLVDEPVAGMTHREMDRTAELLQELAGEHTVVVVEHDMDFVRELAKGRVTVLHEGRVLAEGTMDEVQNDAKVIEVYLGSEAAQEAKAKANQHGVA